MYYSIIYKSSARANFVLPEIENMLLKAKQHNKAHKITGCIIYTQNQFIQIIEGPKNNILELYQSIKKDERHYDVTTLLETESEEMLWNDWSMAFYNFTNNLDSNKHSRILLESYFENANKNQKTSKVFKVLKSNILELVD